MIRPYIALPYGLAFRAKKSQPMRVGILINGSGRLTTC